MQESSNFSNKNVYELNKAKFSSAQSMQCRENVKKWQLKWTKKLLLVICRHESNSNRFFHFNKNICKQIKFIHENLSIIIIYMQLKCDWTETWTKYLNEDWKEKLKIRNCYRIHFMQFISQPFRWEESRSRWERARVNQLVAHFQVIQVSIWAKIGRNSTLLNVSQANFTHAYKIMKIRQNRKLYKQTNQSCLWIQTPSDHLLSLDFPKTVQQTKQ